MEQSIVERALLAKGSSTAADALIRDYLPFIRAQAAKATGRLITEQDDEMSIAMIAFHEAIESFSKSRGAFLAYASLVIRRKLIDYYRKERRHLGHGSLDAPLKKEDDGGASLADVLPDGEDAAEAPALRDATRLEIAELSAQLSDFGLSLSDIADNCPKQQRTLAACAQALAYARQNTQLIAELKRSKKLPLSALSEGSGVERKTLERHRRYIMALMLLYSNGYRLIRGHLKQVLPVPQGGVLT